ncbi:OadG family protein [Romboutsia lituseburensis]|uniref:OadG family protein n=1 Tax=Romboutsia lituseburensis TaxID=1537 RepID=UPI00215B26EC|nr:OadG family protein [Romboutsia lituseburensis]MCR8744964.1 OadG family protein [Romboutsia lituseburensis]
MNINEIINGVKFDIASLSFGEKMIGSIFLAVVSMLIVFCILACISAIISLMYNVFYKKRSNKENLGIEQKFELKNDKCKDETSIHLFEENNENQNEVIAAIMACINQFKENDDSEIIVRKIIRSNNNYSSWNNGIGGFSNDKNL